MVQHVAASDCERIRPGLVAQPANTVSSLAYCVAGGWLWRRATERRWRLVAVAAVAAGLGSVAYHGPGGRLGKALHDASALGLVLAASAASTTTGRPPRPALGGAAAVTFAAATAVHARSRTGQPWCCPDCALQGHALWHVLGAAAVTLAAEASREVSRPRAAARPSRR